MQIVGKISSVKSRTTKRLFDKLRAYNKPVVFKCHAFSKSFSPEGKTSIVRKTSRIYKTDPKGLEKIVNVHNRRSLTNQGNSQGNFGYENKANSSSSTVGKSGNFKPKQVLVVHIPPNSQIEKKIIQSGSGPGPHTIAALVSVSADSANENGISGDVDVTQMTTIEFDKVDSKKIMLVPIVLYENAHLSTSTKKPTSNKEDVPKTIPMKSSIISQSIQKEVQNSQEVFSFQLPSDLGPDVEKVPISSLKLDLQMQVPNVEKIVEDYVERKEKEASLDSSGIANINYSKSAMNLISDFKIEDAEKGENHEESTANGIIPLDFKAEINGVLGLNLAKIDSQNLEELKNVDFNSLITAVTGNIASVAIQKSYKQSTRQWKERQYSTSSNDTPSNLFQTYKTKLNKNSSKSKDHKGGDKTKNAGVEGEFIPLAVSANNERKTGQQISTNTGTIQATPNPNTKDPVATPHFVSTDATKKMIENSKPNKMNSIMSSLKEDEVLVQLSQSTNDGNTPDKMSTSKDPSLKSKHGTQSTKTDFIALNLDSKHMGSIPPKESAEKHDNLNKTVANFISLHGSSGSSKDGQSQNIELPDKHEADEIKKNIKDSAISSATLTSPCLGPKGKGSSKDTEGKGNNAKKNDSKADCSASNGGTKKDDTKSKGDCETTNKGKESTTMKKESKTDCSALANEKQKKPQDTCTPSASGSCEDVNMKLTCSPFTSAKGPDDCTVLLKKKEGNNETLNIPCSNSIMGMGGGKSGTKSDSSSPCAKKDDKKDPCGKKPDPCAKKPDPCEKKPDPCAKKPDPCAKKPDPCAKKPDPCAKKPDPCAKKPDPCEKKPDPCAKKPDPCAKKPDPCAKKPDPCAKKDEKKDPCGKKDGKKDPCAKKDDKKVDCSALSGKKSDTCTKKDDKKDPCAKKPDPCAKKPDPCEKKPDPCAKKPDPCAKKPDPCAKKPDPCEKKPDPCAKKPDPCAKKPDPCAKKPDPCEKKPDPCAKKPDPCEKKPDPCAKKPDPCAKKPDPCAKKPDPCTKKPDPCAKKPDPCAKKPDPCAKKPDPCEKKPDPCAKKSDPCAKKPDPCAKKPDPCAKKPDPCEKKPDPCAKKPDPCAKKPDPCAKKPDPCAKKPDPCTKKPDPCAKKDPCGKENDKKADCSALSGNKDKKKLDCCAILGKKDNNKPLSKIDCSSLGGKKSEPCGKKDDKKSEIQCEKKPDPCAKKPDPCAKKPDPCEKKPDPCAKKPGPCEKKPDPCAKKPDPCAKKPDPCAKKPDPCEKKPDPCAKKPDPCAKKPDPCEKKPDPCAKKPDPCAKKPDPCAKKPDPCEKKPDPCAKKPDPCAKKPDPCAKKDEKKDPCGNKDDKKGSGMNCSTLAIAGEANKADTKISSSKSNASKKDNSVTTGKSEEKKDGDHSLQTIKITLAQGIKIEITTAHINKDDILAIQNLLNSNPNTSKGGESGTLNSITFPAAGEVKSQIPTELNIGPITVSIDEDEFASPEEKKLKGNKSDQKTSPFKGGGAKPYCTYAGQMPPLLNNSSKKRFNIIAPGVIRAIPSKNGIAGALSNAAEIPLQAAVGPCPSRSPDPLIINKVVKVIDCREVCFESVPVPPIGDYDVLLRVDSVGLSGSDLYMYETGAKSSNVVTLGHEASGVVEKVGKCVTNVKVGDNIAVEPGVPCGTCDNCRRGRYNICNDTIFNGSLAKYCIHPSDFCHKLPENCDLDNGALVHPLALALYACNRAKISVKSNVLIIGACPLGLSSVICAKAMGARNVTIVDIMEKNMDVADKLGADITLLVNDKMCNREIIECILANMCRVGEPNVVINCSGCTKSLNMAIMCLAPGGMCVLTGCQSECANFSIMDALMKEITMISSFRSCNMFPHAISLLESCRADVSQMITHRFCLPDVKEAFETALNDQCTEAVKVIVKCQDWEEEERCR